MESSDDELEDTPEFIRHASPIKTPRKNVSYPLVKEYSEPSLPDQPSKLNLLLSEQRKENAEEKYIRERKEELLNNILDGSQEEPNEENVLTDSVTEEQANEIEKYEMKPSELNHIQPGLCVFSCEKHGCLFDETLTPSQGGFTSAGSSIDKLLVTLKPGVMPMLQSKILTACYDKISQPDLIMLWLLFLMSVHSSPRVQKACFTNLKQLMDIQVMSSSEVGKAQTWCPLPLELFQLLVNLGADATTLLVQQSLYSPEEIKNTLEPLQQDRKKLNVSDRGGCGDSLSLVLTVLSICLQARPNLSKQELNVMLHMIATISLDASLTHCQFELQNCLSDIIQCYTDSDWPKVVPEVCKKLCSLSTHHHDHLYLADLFCFGSRAKTLQTGLAYLCLRQQLVPDKTITLSDSHLLDFEYTDIGWLGKTPDPGEPCTLTTSLIQLIDDDDMYKAHSIFCLVDIAVGVESNRVNKPKDQLQYLLDQVKLIIKSIRYDLNNQDKNKVKDLLSRMMIKWSLRRDEKKKCYQRSIFPWATEETHEAVSEEHVRDFAAPTDIDEIV